MAVCQCQRLPAGCGRTASLSRSRLRPDCVSVYIQARSKQCMIGPAEINMKLPVGGLGRAASPPVGSGAEPREPNAFQQKYNENGFKLLTIGGEQACCRTVALLYTPKSDCVVSAVKKKLRPTRLLVRPKPDQPDRLLRP